MPSQPPISEVDLDRPLPDPVEGRLIADRARVAIVAARFNELIVDHLLVGAVNTWRRLGGSDDRLLVTRVPGALELPVTARQLAASGRADAVVCLGCVIRGETDHYDHVVEQTALGLREVATQTGVPCIFGVLTCDTLEQALHRGGSQNGQRGTLRDDGRGRDGRPAGDVADPGRRTRARGGASGDLTRGPTRLTILL